MLLLISSAVTIRRDKSILFSMIVIKIIALCAFLYYNNLYAKPLENGMLLLPLLGYTMSIFSLLLPRGMNGHLNIADLLLCLCYSLLVVTRYSYPDFRVIMLPILFIIFNTILYKLYIIFYEKNYTFYKVLVIIICISIRFALACLYYTSYNMQPLLSIVPLTQDDLYCDLSRKSYSCMARIRTHHPGFVSGDSSWSSLSSEDREHLTLWWSKLVRTEVAKTNRLIQLGHGGDYAPSAVQQFIYDNKNKFPTL